MTTPIILLLSLGGAATSFLSAICGMGGGIVLLSLMTLIMPYSLIIPLHGIIQLVSNSYRTWLLRPYIIWKIFFPFVVGAPIGIFIAVKILRQIKDPTIPLSIIVAIILYTIFKPSKQLRIVIPNYLFFFVGLIVGILGPLVGATGPFIAAFFVREDFSKENIVATKSSVQIIGHILKIPAFLSLGFDYSPHLLILTLMTLSALIGTKIGVQFLKKIDQNLFKKIFKTALFLAALKIIHKIIILQPGY